MACAVHFWVYSFIGIAKKSTKKKGFFPTNILGKCFKLYSLAFLPLNWFEDIGSDSIMEYTYRNKYAYKLSVQKPPINL